MCGFSVSVWMWLWASKSGIGRQACDSPEYVTVWRRCYIIIYFLMRKGEGYPFCGPLRSRKSPFFFSFAIAKIPITRRFRRKTIAAVISFVRRQILRALLGALSFSAGCAATNIAGEAIGRPIGVG
jgi:hypothetical protein